jgi:flagellin-specific chaperone FliS
MCDNNCSTNCEVSTDSCVPTSYLVSASSITEAKDNATSSYITSLLEDIKKLQADLDNEKLNCNRFSQLYQVSLGYIMLALHKNDINELAGVTKRLAEIESLKEY